MSSIAWDKFYRNVKVELAKSRLSGSLLTKPSKWRRRSSTAWNQLSHM